MKAARQRLPVSDSSRAPAEVAFFNQTPGAVYGLVSRERAGARMNRQKFFEAVRTKPFGGSLTPGQVQGTGAILNEWEARGLTDLRFLAYMLATAFHETARTMLPIKEYGGRAYFMKMYDKTGSRPQVVAGLGNTKVSGRVV